MVALITAMFCGMCIYALVRARRALAEALRVRGLMNEAPRTKIREATPERLAFLTGRIRGADDATVRAPFSGEPVVWARAHARTNVGAEIDSWLVCAEEAVLDDGSGAVAILPLQRATVRVPDDVVADSAQVTAYFNEIGRSPGSGEFYGQSVIRPGAEICVVGMVAPSTAAYRQAQGTIRLEPHQGELIVFDEDRENAEPELRRRYIHGSIFGIVVFALLTLLLVFFAAR